MLIEIFFLFCRKAEPETYKQPSHLMDLLDISLGATSISSPPAATDPWGVASPPPPPRPQVCAFLKK